MIVGQVSHFMTMDHCSKKNGHRKLSYEELEEELDYNYGRKEDLKREVRQLELKLKEKSEETEELRFTNFNNAKAHLSREADLKAKIESLEETVHELKVKNKDVQTIEVLGSENRDLKEAKGIMEKDKEKLEETINCLKDDKLKAVSNFEAETKSLRSQIRNLLTCEECGQSFDVKMDMKTHIRLKHAVHEYKCDDCGKCFENFANMKTHIQANHCEISFKCNECEETFYAHDNLKAHISNEHKRKGYIEQILKKENYIKTQVFKQKIRLSDSLYQLKQKEEKQRKKCYCKGVFCTIAHSRYRWIVSQTDILFNKYKLMNSELKRKVGCEKCELEFNCEDILKRHKESHHVSDPKFQCQECDVILNSDECLKSHIKNNHTPTPLETTFFNPSLSRSKFVCQPCDKSFPDEDYLLSHMESEHST